MATTNHPAGNQPQLAPGTWRVDPAASDVRFVARGMFGLVPVRGQFREFDGTLSIDHDDASGELRIQATTLDTRNAKRDRHLRSADFFDVDAHPIVTFELTSATPAADDTIAITGVLRIRDNALAVQAPAHVSAADPDRVTLSTQLSVDRAAAGVGWSKMGMIQGKAHLHASITLTREH
jgi:polyisoprenoid-binding protein YceI